jgi:hypothetical protein
MLQIEKEGSLKRGLCASGFAEKAAELGVIGMACTV